ncbi:MAG TPA: two-component regulator propeller domain-containing protein [Flavobacteriales bacterium]|nr:two-component regulator propeller domain-containing protein [Flavobacteriales bacterium]
MRSSVILLFASIALIACGQPPGGVPAAVEAAPPSTRATLGKKVTGDGQLTEYVRRIFQDSEGNYWFGSNGEGVYRYMPEVASLEVFSTDEGLAGQQVTGIIEDRKGHIWISTNGGVSRFDGRAFTNYTTKEGLPSNGCWSIFEARDGSIWVGTGNGIGRMDVPNTEDTVSGCFMPLAMPSVGSADESKTNYWVACITQDRGGDLWFATREVGALRYDGRAFRWFDIQKGLNDQELACIKEDSKGGVWISSMSQGLVRFEGHTVKPFAIPDIGNNEVWTVIEDRAGDIWFSSEGYGVYRYDGNGLRNYGAEQGLGVLAVQTIHQDREGQMWFGGGGGLYRLEGETMVHVKRNGPWR